MQFDLPDEDDRAEDESELYPRSLQTLPRQAKPEVPPCCCRQWRDRLRLDSLEQGRQQLIFLLMMPGVEPHRLRAVLFEARLQQVHQRTLAAAPSAVDRQHERRLRSLVAQEEECVQAAHRIRDYIISTRANS